MVKRSVTLSTRTFRLRTRVAALAAGVGASAVLGVGVAVAAGTTEGKAATEAVAAKVPADAAAKKATVRPVEAKAPVRPVEVKAPARPAEAKAPARTAPSRPAAWVGPVKHYTLSARFNQAGGMWRSTHSGQDFAVPSGTGVLAACGGTVVKAGPNGAGDGPAYGNAIVIRHPNGMHTQYAHLARIDVRVGETVARGQHIGLSGNTGNSSGPHLHFEIRTTPNYGSAVDPLAYLRSKGVGL
ncbi:M23 family metallopeptidase [Streptomyces chiangmaiensis]|uniref:M23 family metallopeptidase n=1 Tax=Streptomyces chiangmaiensis TaxID=766497 RepID=A0ABU7FNX0_9ACTN|nr:M23 family metallopeptidase [Streptomyces chiangmaiensis]MED7825664.1 M23 family metallopeptidase [Streptomyces chiangmaiensis]